MGSEPTHQKACIKCFLENTYKSDKKKLMKRILGKSIYYIPSVRVWKLCNYFVVAVELPPILC